MNVTFKKPPTLSLICYAIGFILIVPTVIHQLNDWNWLSFTLNQQLFLAGAIVVAIGSVINWWHSFFKKQ